MVRKSSPILDPQERAELRKLAGRLREAKPGGWSMVLSENEIVVTPADRSVGKFGVKFSRAERIYVTFFSRELSYWNKSAYFGKSGDFLAEILNWMTAEVLVPTERRKPDDKARLS